MTWRDDAKPLIARVLAANAGKPATEVRRALRAAYPYGPRENWPYKVWCDEIARQTGRKPAPKPRTVRRTLRLEAAGQGRLFHG